MATTRYEWITTLGRLSRTVARLHLIGSLADQAYRDTVARTTIHRHAYNFSGCPDHCAAIARWTDALSEKGVSDAVLRKLLTDLTSGRSTYGAYCELAAYGMLSDHDIPFVVQVPTTGEDVLNPHGSDLDGQLDLNGPVLFDVKAFGLQEHLVERLTERLGKDLAPDFVATSGNWSIAVADAEALLGDGYEALRSELASTRNARRGKLEFELRAPGRVQMTLRELDPYELAEENAAYAFNFAKQFAKRRPFLLIFVLHPWLGGQTLSVNFDAYADTFARALARRTFMQFLRDRKNRHFGVSRAVASRMLSGLLFLDGWAAHSPTRKSARLYLNPHARRSITTLDTQLLSRQIPYLTIEDFSHDTY